MELVLSDEKDVDFLVSRICTYATLLASAFALVLSLSVDSLFRLLSEFGWISDPAYLDAARVVPLIALAYVVHSLEHHFATGMHVAKKTRFATGIAIASLAVVFVTNIVLIPRWGFLAAGISVLLGVSMRSLLFLAYSQRVRPISFEFRI